MINEDDDKPEETTEEQPEENDEKSSDAGDSAKDDENKEDSADSEDEDLTSDKPFAGLDLRKAKCFGYSVPKEKNWLWLAKQADDIGWNLIDKKQLERNLATDVEESYSHIAAFSLVNVDDDVEYVMAFDNNRQLWDIDIAYSPKAEIDSLERSDFFKSDLIKKIVKIAYKKLVDAKNSYEKIVKPRLENGELLLVDAVKLDAILHFLKSDYFMKNLIDGKYFAAN